jgi:hypothetical protein
MKKREPRHLSERTKEILRRKNKGRHFSPETEFKKGQTPWNKGLKGIRLSRKSEFKRGHRPANWKPVGTIVIRTEGKRNPNKRFRKVRYIKIAESNVWIPYARYVMTKKRGREIPKRMIVLHRDYDSLNDDPGNLITLTRGCHINFLKIDNIIDEKERRKNTSIRLLEYWEEKRKEELI